MKEKLKTAGLIGLTVLSLGLGMKKEANPIADYEDLKVAFNDVTQENIKLGQQNAELKESLRVLRAICQNVNK